ncbi:hypothetical protein LX36DRAFT_223657 [Colletotrichum falcatum]|nr:hypothetical protein LX36DRAFT_223657 [Colletotrichum falcatum]
MAVLAMIQAFHTASTEMTKRQGAGHTQCCLERGKRRKIPNGKNIQHQAFTSRHRPDYYSGPYWLVYGRSDGIPSSPVGMVVCMPRLEPRLLIYHFARRGVPVVK